MAVTQTLVTREDSPVFSGRPTVCKCTHGAEQSGCHITPTAMLFAPLQAFCPIFKETVHKGGPLTRFAVFLIFNGSLP